MATRIHHVPLGNMPGEVSVPETLQDRFWFDEERRRLCFVGFMSKCTYDRLELLSDDVHYQRALEDLFRTCVPDSEAEIPPAKRMLGLLIAAIGLVAVCGVAAYMLVGN